MNLSNRSVRGVALLTGTVVASMALLPMQSAQAADKSKTYKTGAIALGVLGAYMAVKGKTLPAVVAGAGAYYAYKKSKDADNGYDRSARNPGDVYPDDVNANRRTNDNRTADSRTRDNDIFASRNDGAYDDGAYSNGSYDDGAYNNDPGYIGLSQSASSGTTVLK